MVLLAPMGEAAAGKIVVERRAAFKHAGLHHRPKQPVIPPHAKAIGKTYSEWSAAWWQWAYALPADETVEAVGEVDVDCNPEDQQGRKVWFLAGAAGDWPDGEVSAERTCEEPIPHEKALFFPIVNLICTDLGGDGTTEDELLGCANFIGDFNYPIGVPIDGKPVKNLDDYLVVSPAFEFHTSDVTPVIHGFPTDTDGLGASSGYYLLLPPLPKGDHTIDFSGRVLAPDFGVDWKVHVIYHFTVAKVR